MVPENGAQHTAYIVVMIYVYEISSNYFHLLKSYAVDKERTNRRTVTLNASDHFMVEICNWYKQIVYIILSFSETQTSVYQPNSPNNHYNAILLLFEPLSFFTAAKFPNI